MQDPIIGWLIKFEGVRQTPYKDHLGHWTIGIGHLIKDNESWLRSAKLTKGQVYGLLNTDIAIMRSELRRNLPWVYLMPENVVLALELMAFQLGVGGLMTFRRTLAAVRAYQFDRAADLALESRWARQTPSRAIAVTDILRGA